MARLPRRPATHRPPVDPFGGPVAQRDAPRAGTDALSVAGIAEREARRAGVPAAGGSDHGVELDAAIDALLEAGGVEPVTRAELGAVRRVIAAGSQPEGAGSAEGGASLSQALYRSVMPRLHHPEVLRGERQRALLETLADGLAEADEDGVVREGALIIRRELRRLAMLRAGRNALIEV